jgi:hypothetical protein
VAALDDVVEVGNGDAGIAHGAIEVGVAEDLLDVADISAALEEVRGAAVPPMSLAT